MLSNNLLLPILPLLGSVIADPSKATLKACKEIEKALPDRVSYPWSIDYETQSSEYWSTLLRDIDAACVLVPECADEVSTAVKILNKYPDVNFTAKSGGHDPNVGHATVKDGVLISLSAIAGATYDKDSGLAYVKPGGEWNDVISDLAKDNVTVVGGRLGLVGVGGYLLQGGISFLSAQYGLAADSIVGWEIVSADGTIVNVDAKEEPEFAVALRGSGSQFGIVTKFTVRAYPIGQVWGGIRIYGESKTDEILSALHNFTPKSYEDQKAAVIVSNTISVSNSSLFIVFYFYQNETAPTTGAFADFLKIDASIDTTKTQSYADLLKSNGEGAASLNSRISFRTLTIPYIAAKPSVYLEISNKFREITEGYFGNLLHLLSQCSVDFQPFPSIIGTHSEERGGNAMGLTGDDGDRVLLEIQCAWKSEQYDEVMPQFSRNLTSWIESKIPEWIGTNQTTPYLPLFMNDAMGDQNVTGSYKDYAKLKAIQAKADPEGTLRRRTGGFKY